MNAKGGTLYIGVNNNGNAIGIEQDYPLLNSSTTDKNKYAPNIDGYENKIRNAIRRSLNPEAIDYVDISFPEHNGHTVCVVNIEESRTVIWVDNYCAYKRTGNSTTHLRSTAIEKLILDKMELKRPDGFRIKPIEVKEEDEVISTEDADDFESVETPTTIKVNQPETIKHKGEVRQGHGSFYMNLFSNGDWSWSKDIPNDEDLEFCVPINSPASKNSLIMVYEDGCVNRVNAYNLHITRKKANKRYQNGRRNDGVKLINVFHAKEDDLLACLCKQDGHEFVKTHMVSHVSLHDQMQLKGNVLINTSSFERISEIGIHFVASEHHHRISDLMKTENQKSNSLGIQMDLQRNAKYLHVVNTLKVLLNVPAKN